MSHKSGSGSAEPPESNEPAPTRPGSDDIGRPPPPDPDRGAEETGRLVARTGRNAVFLSVSFLSQIVSQILLLSIIGRLAGVANAGLWAYVIAFVDPFQVVTDFGTTRMLVPEISRRREDADLLLGNALTLSGLLAIPALAFLVAIGNLDFLDHSETTVLGLYLGGVAAIFSNLAMSIRSAFRAFNRFDLEAVNSIIMAFVLVGGSLAVLLTQASFLWVFVAYIVSALAGLLSSWLIYNRFLGRVAFRFEPAILRQVVSKSWIFMFIVLLFRAYMRLDLLILRYFHGEVAVGYYGLVTALFYRLDIITRLLMTSLLPSMSRIYVTNRDRVGKYLNLALKAQILAVLPIALGGLILASPIVFLLYGSDYAPSVLFFQLLIIVIPLRFVIRTFTVTLTAMDLQRRVLQALVLVVAFNIVGNLLLIPQYAALGATITSMASEALLFVLAYLSLTATVRKGIQWGNFARPLLTIPIMAPVLYLVRDWPLWFSLPIGAIVYCLALLVVRAFSLAEARAVTSLIDSVPALPLSLRRRLSALLLARAHG